jgi:hypothetical protein
VSDTVEPTDTAFPLSLDVNRSGSGGVAGLTPLVALRRVSDSLYLDFTDGVFKASGWTTRQAALAAVGSAPGHYERALNVAALALPAGAKYTAEFHVENGTDIKTDVTELLVISDVRAQVTRVRQSVTNRSEVNLSDLSRSTLDTYQDDGTTLLARQTITDGDGRPVLPAIGTPAHRGADS